MIKIVITGVECSGKTTLAQDIAESFQATFVSEYSRQFLTEINRPYTKSDLISIALGQQKAEAKAHNSNIVICDTSLLVLKVWSMVKYKSVHPWITVLLQDAKPDLYILPDCDIPFEPDPLRESEGEREELRKIYVNELNDMDIPWISVTGSPKQRLKQAMKRIEILIGTNS